MLTPAEFPYLRQLVINDCFAHQNLTVPVSGEGEPFKHLILTGKNGSGKTTVLKALREAIAVYHGEKGKVRPSFRGANGAVAASFAHFSSSLIIAFFEAYRKVHMQDVQTVTRETGVPQQPGQSGAAFFKQYLVNKKVYQVFDVMEGKEASAQQDAQFFADLEDSLTRIFEEKDEDRRVKLEFVREEFEFYICLSDGRRFTCRGRPAPSNW